MRIPIIVILLLLLSAPPVIAQDSSTPVPTLSAGAQTVIQQTTQAVDRYGVITVALFVILLGVLALVLRIVVPLLNSNTAANQQIALMNQNSSKLQFDTVAGLNTLGSSMGNLVGSLSQLATVVNGHESKTDAHEDRLAMADKINTHSDEAVKPVSEAAASTLETVKSIETKLDKLMTLDDFNDSIKDQMQPVREEIAELRRTIEERLLPVIQAVQLTPPQMPAVPSTPTPPDQVGNAPLAPDESSKG